MYYSNIENAKLTKIENYSIQIHPKDEPYFIQVWHIFYGIHNPKIHTHNPTIQYLQS